MAPPRHIYLGFGLLAALLFGAGSQLSKLMLSAVEPVTMAGLLYLGSGAGLLLLTIGWAASGKRRDGYEARLTKSDLPVLGGTMFFGTILAPVTLMLALPHTPAATAALLLNFEAVATTLFAVRFAGEPVGKRIWLAILLITLSCVLLSYKPEAALGISLGAVGVILTCTFWGIDNNILQRISGKDPVFIVMIKGLVAGGMTFLLARLIGEAVPAPEIALAAMAIGFIGFGGIMSIAMLFAIRGLGSARAGALISLSPFFGVGFAFLIFADMPGALFFIALVIMVAGTYLLITEEHNHEHTHPAETHDHRHLHPDIHHDHDHAPGMPPIMAMGSHSHPHSHDAVTHAHAHSPDIHHRHRH